MAHLAFIAPPFLGHLDPMRALARALAGRGHRVTFFGIPDAGALIADADLGFRPVGRDTHPPGHLAAMVARMAAAGSLWGLAGILRDVAAMTAMLVRDLPEALRSAAIDLVVCDGTEAAGGLVADGMGLPHVTVANALPLNREPAIPPTFMGWPYDPTPKGISRNRGGYRVADLMMHRHRAVIVEAAGRWRLGPRETVADCLSGWAQVSQTVAGLDFPRVELPAVFHHVGPLRDHVGPLRERSAAGPPPIALPPGDDRPLAYASLGSLQGGRIGLFRTIAAAAERTNLCLVLAHGGRMSDAQAASLPGAPTVRAFVPQAEVLAGAQVAILNGGLNTVMDALAAGVPILAVPIAFEQAAIAARIAHAGAGQAVGRRFLTAGRLARAVDDVLSEPGYRRAARRLAVEIAAAGGFARAADIVETVLRTGRPVTRDEAAATSSHDVVACQEGRPSASAKAT